VWVGGESKRSCQALKLSLTWALASYWRSRQVIAGHGRRRSMRVRRGGARASGSKRFRASCRIDGTRNGARLRCVRAEECVNDIEGTPGKSEAFPARKRLIGRADSSQCSREPCNKNDLVNNGKSHVTDHGSVTIRIVTGAAMSSAPPGVDQGSIQRVKPHHTAPTLSSTPSVCVRSIDGQNYCLDSRDH